MTEYIERDKALEKVINTGLCDAQGNMYGAGDVVFVDDIQTIPTSDVAPVVHGRWIETEFWCGPHLIEVAECSVCRKSLYVRLNSAFCPCCGAKMDMK